MKEMKDDELTVVGLCAKHTKVDMIGERRTFLFNVKLTRGESKKRRRIGYYI